MKIKKSVSILSFYLTLSLIAFISVSHAATISGSICESDGITLITGTDIQVQVWEGDPCGGRDWVTSVYTATGLYTTPNLSEGTYYLQTSNMNQSNYLNEWWADTASVISCRGAQSVTVSTVNIIGKDFQLDVGYSISGMVYQSNGSTPIPDNNIRVEVYTGDPCDDREWIGSAETSVGNYTIMGIPPGDYYLQARSYELSTYASEWWADSNSVFYCSEAESVTVVNTTVTGKNYQLDIGGSVTGVVVNDSGAPQADLEVSYWNDLCSEWKSVDTDIDGSFEIIGLPPGPVEIEIEPDVDTWLVKYEKTYSCLALGENSDLGTIELPYGALITGVIQDVYSNPFFDIDVSCGTKFAVAWDETNADGSFALRIPVGTYSLNFVDDEDEDEHIRMPVEITVNDVGTPQNLGILIAYDLSSREQISGTIDYGSYAGPGEFIVVAFLNTTEITPENFGGIRPFATAEPDQATGEYSLYVVPQTERPGTTVNLMLILIHGATDAWESVTLIDENEGIVTSPTPVTGQNLAYSTLGSDHSVSGFVKNGEGGVVYANVLLYKQPGDEFFGFAETDCDGAYSLYNVPEGTYRIAATAYGYDATEWSGTFNVVNANIAIPDIFMGIFGDELAVDFGSNGIYHYDNDTWQYLSSSNPSDMENYNGDLVVDLDTSGIYLYDGTWTWLTSTNPEDMLGAGTDLYTDFGSAGIYKYDGTWTWLTSTNPEDMVAVGTDLYADFGSAGIYKYDGTWTWLTSTNPEDMVAVGTDLYADFGSAGIYKYDGTWTWLTSTNPEGMVAVGTDIYTDFGSAGIYKYDGTWTWITSTNPEDMVAVSTDLYADFGSAGIYKYDGTWTWITSTNAEDMVAVSTDLYADFGSAGIYKYDGTWTWITSTNPEDMIAVDINN